MTIEPAVPAGTQSGRCRDTPYQRSWYWYDWANSAYVTTTATVLFSPYLTAVATEAVCPGLSDAERCTGTLSVLGIPISPGSIAPYTITVSTILSALVLIAVGAIADRSPRPARLLGGIAWTGSLAACGMFFVTGTNWQLGVALLIVGTMCLGSSLVVYDGLLNRIAAPDDRDRVSSRGWAMGYAGGGLLLAANFALDLFRERLGLDRSTTTRISLLSAGVWWGLFTLIPVRGLRRLSGSSWSEGAPPPRATPATSLASAVRGSVAQLRDTFADLRHYPQTLLFLLAYLFYNDGIQTVIANSSLYGIEQLKFPQSTVLAAFLFVQFIALFGALGFGRVAQRIGAHRTVLISLGLWTAVVGAAYLVPERAIVMFFALALGIGVVLGGSQAISRSLFSQLVPAGRESEYFSLYQAMERGTSWFGTLTFGVVYQVTSSYRWSILALIGFFVVGTVLLSRVRLADGIVAAGNPLPRRV